MSQDEEQEVVNLLDEEAALENFRKRLSIPSIVQSNKMYLILVGFTEDDIKYEFKANFTTLNWLMDLDNSNIFLDFGLNRQKLTRPLLNWLAEID